MALRHGDGPNDAIEVACNLLDPDSPLSSPAAVQHRLEELAAAEGVAVGQGYRIGRSPQEYVAMALEKLRV